MSTLSRREDLRSSVTQLLESARDGHLPDTRETQSIDFKEEAGRRNGSQIEPGEKENPEAATKLADEVACMANTPGGGALILGVEDSSGRIIGTELDTDWLRYQINRRIQVAPDIVEHVVQGQRLLVLYVAEAREPVTNTSDSLRWRVGDHCVAVDRSEWWEHKDRSREIDQMAQPSAFTLQNASSTSIRLARQWSQADSSLTDAELLRQFGALRSDEFLTEAGALLFVPQNRTYLELSIFDVPGGQVLNRSTGDAQESLLEQIATIEDSVESVNDLVTRQVGLSHQSTRLIPELAIRESILNGVIHRDWNRHESTELRWVRADSTLTVRSPGGFVGGITQDNVLSNRDARYPALADLFRAIGLVDKLGVGIDRMYQAMIVLGHRPPLIEEVDGAFIECTLVGGEPVYPVVDLVSKIIPVERQKDYRVSIIIYLLLHEPFITADRVATFMQSSKESALSAIETTRQTTVDGEPLIKRFKKAWILGDSAFKTVVSAQNSNSVFPLLPYHSTDSESLSDVAQHWLQQYHSITSGDLLALTRISRGTAKSVLDALVEDGKLVSLGSGRSSRYELTQSDAL